MPYRSVVQLFPAYPGSRWFWWFWWLGLTTNCGGHAPPVTSFHPPTPSSVTIAEPGGDATDTHAAALQRLATAPWGVGNDRDDQVRVPLVDPELWKRVRYWGFEHFTGFRYGDAHHAIAVGFVQPLSRLTRVTSEACLEEFENAARPRAEQNAVQFGAISENTATWRGQPLKIRAADGEIDTLLISTGFSAAWAAYPAYPHSCFVYVFVVPWRGSPSPHIAQGLRQRWVQEAFTQFEARTPEPPQRL